MVTIPRTIEKAQPQASNITVQLSIAQQRIQTLEQENRQLKQYLVWERRLFSNPHLSASQKLTEWAIVPEIDKGTPTTAGLTPVNITYVSKKIGLSPKTTGRNLQELAEAQGIIRQAETSIDNTGQVTTVVYFAKTPQTLRPQEIIPPQPRNHGGLRTYCKDCGSENLAEQKTIICLDCGSVQSQTTRLINPTDGQDENRSIEEQTAPPMDNLTGIEELKEPMDNLTAGTLEKPTTPPMVCSTLAPAIITWQMGREQERPAAHTGREAEQQPERELDRAAYLLLDIAGDTPSAIIMPGENGKKYKTVHRPLTLLDMRDHLTGRKTYGATLKHSKGTTTRALCFDTDDKPTDIATWQTIQEAATLLIAEGYKPLLEPSPANRGGHMWLIFSDRVNTRAAYSQVVSIAPQLAEVGEYWPSGRNQKVRLPAGRYVTATSSQWTHLLDGDREENAKNEAAPRNRLTILLSNLTPATLIPIAEPEDQPAPGRPAQPERSAQQHHRTATNEPDETHRRKYGDHKMWVAWPDEQYLIDRFNETHSIDDLAQPERNGMINAAEIGRPERTASVGVTPDGKRYTDFGAEARQPDGSQDGGDPLEYKCRKENRDKADVLRELGRELNRAASKEILRAARAGEPLPAWIIDILSPTGRQVYNENARAHGHRTLEQWGVAGFSMPEQAEQPQELTEPETINIAAQPPTLSATGELWQREQKTEQSGQDYEGDYPPPQRHCIACRVTVWKWTGEKYICGNPGHPLE